MGAVVSNSMMGDRYVAVCGKLKVLYDPLKAEALVYIGDPHRAETLARESWTGPQILKFKRWWSAAWTHPRDHCCARHNCLPKLGMHVNDRDWFFDNNLVENAVSPLDLGRRSTCSRQRHLCRPHLR